MSVWDELVGQTQATDVFKAAAADARSLAEATRFLVSRGAPNPFRREVLHSGTGP